MEIRDCIERRGRSNSAAWVVMLHGFGANAADLKPLSLELDPEGRRHWLFPEAPVLLGEGPGGPSRAWFPRNRHDLELAYSGAYFRDLPSRNPPGLAEAAAEILALLASRKIDPSTTVFGGFSQGSMVALRTALATTPLPPGALLFSSALIAAEDTAREAAGHSMERLSFLQTHGTADPILPFAGARALYELLTQSGHRGRFLSFPGGHAIPAEVIEAGRGFLEAL